MAKRMSVLPLLLIPFLLADCGRRTEPDLQGRADPILNGDPVPDGEHMAVCYLSTPGAACTATLITRRVVLTAAHCVEDADADSTAVYFGSTPTHAVRVEAEEILVHPAYSPDHLLNDIALLRLADDAPADITPIPHLPASLEITSGDLGVELTFVGFGLTETDSSGRKMWMTAELAHVCTRSGGCWPGKRNTICVPQWPTGICSGDSGGPAFVDRDGTRYVAGVNSYTFENCVEYGCATKVDAFQEFIDDFIGSENGASCSANRDCASDHCEDGVCCNQRCAGTCESCALPDHEGTCLPRANGASCADPNRCNGLEVCQDGSCQAGEPLDCTDQVACTKDLCDPNRGCVFQASSLACFDDNPCTDDVCDVELGCRYENKPDGMYCDPKGKCLAGVCVSNSGGGGCGCGVGPGAADQAGWVLILFAAFFFRRRRVC